MRPGLTVERHIASRAFALESGIERQPPRLLVQAQDVEALFAAQLGAEDEPVQGRRWTAQTILAHVANGVCDAGALVLLDGVPAAGSGLASWSRSGEFLLQRDEIVAGAAGHPGVESLFHVPPRTREVGWFVDAGKAAV
jgi:hypothetical protein